MKTKTINLYTVDELKEQFPAGYQRALEEHARIEGELWTPIGDYYFQPPEGEILAAFETAKKEGAQFLYGRKEEMPEFVRSAARPYFYPGMNLFNFSERGMYYDLYRGSDLSCADLTEQHEQVFYAWLQIPPRLWSLLSVQIRFKRSRNGGKNFLRFVLRSNNETIREDEESEYELSARLENILKRAERIFQTLLDNALTCLQDDFEYACSEENFVELSRCNDYHYTADGEMQNE